ncbi:MAG: FtsQ-type POTRA domain-containing protein [Sneathiellaceae bacterium]
MSWFRRSPKTEKPARGRARAGAREKAAARPKAAAKVRSGAEVLVDRPAGGRLRWRPAMTGAALLLVPVLAVGGAVLLAPQDTGALVYEAGAELADASAATGLAVDSITVEGRDKTALDDLREAIDVNRGDPILFLDLEEVRARLAGLPWVKDAAVERRLPDNLHVRLQEREPFVRWQNGGRTVLIDREGVVLASAVGGEFTSLRRLVGKGAPDQATALFDMLQAEAPLFDRVAVATRIRERRWDVTFDNGVVLRLPEEGTRQAWQRFAQLQAAEGLLDKDIRVIDLRVPDRVILQLTPEAVQARAVPGKNT